MRGYVSFLARKEILEDLRTSKGTLILILILALYQQFFTLQKYSGIFKGREGLLLSVVSSSVLYLAPIVIPFYGNSILVRSLQRERANKSIMILMTTGLEVGTIWMVKVFISFIISYFIYLVCAVMDIGMITVILKLPFEFTIYNVAGILILSPLFSLSLFLILAFLFWYFRNTLMITTFYTIGVTFGIWGVSMAIPVSSMNQYLLLACALLLPLVLIALFSNLISKQPKHKIAAI